MTPFNLLDPLNQSELKGKRNIIEAFNKHFINAGSVTCSHFPVDDKDSEVTTISCYGNSFAFSPISPTQVYKALSSLDCKKFIGPDQIEPHFFLKQQQI